VRKSIGVFQQNRQRKQFILNPLGEKAAAAVSGLGWSSDERIPFRIHPARFGRRAEAATEMVSGRGVCAGCGNVFLD